MGVTALQPINPQSIRLVKIAREIAIDHKDVETILKEYKINPDQWETIKGDPDFQRVLTSEIEAWNSATNTHERTKLKAAALLEEFLPEANTRLHDREESLSGKTELAKLVARIAGMGLNTTGIEGGGEKLSVTINLGGEATLQFEKTVAPRVIEGEVMRESE